MYWSDLLWPYPYGSRYEGFVYLYQIEYILYKALLIQVIFFWRWHIIIYRTYIPVNASLVLKLIISSNISLITCGIDIDSAVNSFTVQKNHDIIQSNTRFWTIIIHSVQSANIQHWTNWNLTLPTLWIFYNIFACLTLFTFRILELVINKY